MIGYDKYIRMLAGERVVRVAEPDQCARDMMPDDADRLEAALDAALLGNGIRLRFNGDNDGFRLLMRVPLADLRTWLGDDRDGWTCEGRWEWTKWRISELFDREMAPRYAAAGWGRCRCWWDSQQSRDMLFELLPSEGAGRPPDAVLRSRALDALDGLGAALGVESGCYTDMGGRRATEYLEDLRLAAVDMRFNLDAARREARGVSDDGPR